ncbi:NAD-dependent succinate-semialdehyde dehydrogenase [Pueribacillus sp. YX66]|uniref:NAD-dependent succinate-semialdehyde dehydrogenase n=1 Tax=Pueribacillus sp. YX66 TaxID=3229242 RepID=UPI00358D86A4
MDKLIYVNGIWTGEHLEKIKVSNPATGECIGTVPNGGRKETREAIDAAYKAFPEWSKLTAYERSAYLEKLYDLMIEAIEPLAEMMTLEMGKPLAESRGEVQYAASFIKWYAEEGKRVYGRTIPSHVNHKRMIVTKQPVGVVGAITPWNFPAAMITRKLGPALAAGCTFVVKPADETPLTAIMLAELCERAGIPKGVINVITGKAAPIGEELLTNPRVNKITFTGSTEVGKLLLKQGADQVKNMSMELGGHAPILILDDADIDKAVNNTLLAKFRNGGQTCICGNRIYVEAGIHDEFVERFVRAASKLKVGNGMKEGIDIGPVINRQGYEKIDRHVQNALKQGAKCVLGGSGIVEGDTYFYNPTILTNVKPGMIIMNEETFGPIAPIQKVNSEEEAIKFANQTPYGLAAYVYTENYAKGIRIAEKLNYGIVGWNDGVPSAAQSPFGGMKQSGIGREGGTEGIESYLETKYITVGL